MDNRDRYNRLLKLLTRKKILKNDSYGIAKFVDRLKEELSKPTLDNYAINNLLDKITRDGNLPEDIQRIFDEIRSGCGTIKPATGNYAKADIYHSNTNIWPYK